MPRIALLSTAHVHTKPFLAKIAEVTSGKAPHVIWDDVAERGQQYAASSGCRFEGDLDAVLADPNVDGFLICAENTRHLPLLEKALPVGKPVMCEKPLATTIADARAIADLVRKHNNKLISGYFQPFDPTNIAAKQLLTDGTLGKVTHAFFRNAHHAAYGHWFDSPEVAWFAKPELSGGGALLDMGTHAVHLLRHLFGPVKRVWAMYGNYSGIYADVDDYGLIQMEFANGVLGRVEAGWIFTSGLGGLEIVGSERAIARKDGKLMVVGPECDPQSLPTAEAKPTRIERLVALIRGELSEEELAEDLAASLDAVTIMAAAYEAGKTGTWQDVETL